MLHVAATVRLFDPTAIDRPATVYHGATKAMRRSDLFALCRAALEAAVEPLGTRQLARHVITVEGWDVDDTRLRLAIAHKVGATMKRMSLHGAVRKVGERQRASVWRIAQGAGRPPLNQAPNSKMAVVPSANRTYQRLLFSAAFR